jgi:S-adenosylhomocysteine hydrolase
MPRMTSSAATVNVICPKFALLERAIQQFNLKQEAPFRGFGAIVAQHLLPSIVPLFEALFTLGLHPSRVAVLAKCYSTSNEVAAWLRTQGVHVILAAENQPGQYYESLKWAAAKIWSATKNWRDITGVIGIDHGGVFRLTQPTKLAVPIVYVEHTSQGIFRVPRNFLPCIDMARSHVKKKLESEIIGRQLVAALFEMVPNLKNLSVAVIGLGSIGTAVSLELASLKVRVRVFDPNPQLASALQKRVTFYDEPRQLIADSAVILGCTGVDISVYLNGISGFKTLASCSSDDVEFSEFLDTNATSLTPRGSDFELQLPSGKVRILEKGFPINFAWAKRHTDEEIALTRVLTLFSATQASRMLRANLYVELNQEFQEFFTINTAESAVHSQN